MKRVAWIVFLCALIGADEIERVDTILADIAKIRLENQLCQNELDRYRALLAQKEDSVSSDESENLKIQIKEYKDLVLQKEKEILSLKNSIDQLKKVAIQEPKVVEKILYKERFVPQSDPREQMPELIKKEKYQTKSVTVEKMRATTFKMATSAPIYDAPHANILEEWEALRSFTSSTKSGMWIRIDGFFVDKKWQRSSKEMWVEGRFVKIHPKEDSLPSTQK